ncbi:uncharacterized protein PV09_06437 [Verruconis gallopava]|uniref:MIND kinetochore complex component Nnf1 n=1 Tax=Verruconis gallopava TaxID=253628 RepID=A0A0D1YNJ5_9PEZI|nr:uncharacterized protein PV09_06437 [Verruconis gallopava]KIW02287.1 hypothetical protein PV09_06437 [Verruconis gallopava]
MAAMEPEPAASAASPPPSPLPAPPEDSTPGARATALQNAFTKALEATLSKCSYANFAACFPTPAKYRPQTLEMFHKDFTGRLSEVCTAEFATILKERNVVPLLNSLDRLISEAKARKQSAEAAAATSAGPDSVVETPIPPHTLPPAELVNAHLAAYLEEKRAAVAAETAEVSARNEQLAATIRQQREEMDAFVRGLEAVVADLERSAALVQADDVTSLTAEVKAVEDELRT